jgi:hypothetical protein
MRSTILIRCGIASLLIGGGIGGMFAAGCGSDDNGSTPGGNDAGDSGNNQPPGDDGSTTDDGGTTTHPDAGDAGDSGPVAPPHGKLILVHASAGAPPLRFCFGLSLPTDAGTDAAPASITVPPTYPAPNTALGLPPGTGGAAADSTMDLKSYNITVYAILASALVTQTADAGATELTCKQLIGAAALPPDGGGLPLAEGQNYFTIGTLPAGTLADQSTTIALVNGCVPGINDSNDSLVECPTGYSAATGDLNLTYSALDTTTALDGGSLGAQFVYATTPLSNEAKVAGGSGAVAAGFYVSGVTVAEAGVPDAGDAGDAAPVVSDAGPVLVPFTNFIPVAVPVTNGQIAPSTLVPVSGLTFDGTSGFTAGAIGADGGTAFAVSLPLPTIQALSYPGASVAEFANGFGYVFVLVGDPNPQLPPFIGPTGTPLAPDAGGVFNTQVAHILAFPVNPPFGN